jgi:hypothetical protein
MNIRIQLLNLWENIPILVMGVALKSVIWTEGPDPRAGDSGVKNM